MSLPPLVEVPPASIRLSLSPNEWQACFESWLALSEMYLRLPDEAFQRESTDSSSLVKFARSFYYGCQQAEETDRTLKGQAFNSPTGDRLTRACFMLVHRTVTGPNPPFDLLRLDFLVAFCHFHEINNPALSKLIPQLWNRSDNIMKDSLEKTRQRLIKAMDSNTDEIPYDDIGGLAYIMKTCSGVGQMLMTGSDFFDGLIARYSRSKSAAERNGIAATSMGCLWSLVQPDQPNFSLISDHLYSLKAAAEATDSEHTLAARLSNGFLLSTFGRKLVQKGGEQRNKMLQPFMKYTNTPLPKMPVRRKRPKGKGKVVHDHDEMHMHRMSLVTQVQDLFPDLGSGFVLKLLDEYKDDVEQVTAHLLDNSLPPHLKDLDRSEDLPSLLPHENGNIESLEPRSTPPPPEPFIPERRNVFDDDELDRLEVDTSRLHMGKKKDTTTSSGQTNKAAILSALAAFDSDDDERDDTYDVDDVGGTVDTTNPGGEPGDDFNDKDMILFGKYVSSPDIFARTADARKKKGRHALKAETRMTDEAIEGWAIMLQRDPKRLRRLETQFNNFDGKQTEVTRTAYREGVEGTETEDSDGHSSRGGFRGGFRGRGRGRGRGGNVAGPNKDPTTGVARDRKEANKGSRANHNRRDQRARKMARGGFAG